MAGLAVLGVGWNFLFVSCTSLITGTYHTEGEKARVQSANDFLIYGTMILSSFLAGPLEERIGWFELNRAALVVTAAVGVGMLLLMWRSGRRASGRLRRHQNSGRGALSPLSACHCRILAARSRARRA